MSCALNHSGFEIAKGKTTMEGANGLFYIVSSQHMFDYLDRNYYQYGATASSPSKLWVYPTTFNWGLVVQYRKGRVDHVDVVYIGKFAWRDYRWEGSYLFAN